MESWRDIDLTNGYYQVSDFYKNIDGLDEFGRFILTEESVTIPQLRKRYLLERPPRSWRYVWVKNELI